MLPSVTTTRTVAPEVTSGTTAVPPAEAGCVAESVALCSGTIEVSGDRSRQAMDKTTRKIKANVETAFIMKRERCKTRSLLLPDLHLVADHIRDVEHFRRDEHCREQRFRDEHADDAEHHAQSGD